MTQLELPIYIVGIIVGLVITYFFFRWVFSINKILKQNQSIINLLTILAKKSGANNEEIHSATN